MGKRKPVVWFRYFSFSFPLLISVALRNLAAAGCKMQFQWCGLVWRLGCTNLVPQTSQNYTAVHVAFFSGLFKPWKPLLCRIKHALAKTDHLFCGASFALSNTRHSTTTGRKDLRKPELRTRYDQLYVHMCTKESVWSPNSSTPESDRQLHDRPAARVIAQQYSPAIFHSRKTNIGASFRNVVSEFLKIFSKIP